MTVRIATLLAAAGFVAVLAGGCGEGVPAPDRARPALTGPRTAASSPATAAAAAGAPLGAAERRLVAERRRRERPHFSSPALGRMLADRPPAEQRAALVRSLRRAILRDARRRVARGQLEGPVLDVDCDVAREDAAHAAVTAAAPVLRYSCLAVRVRVRTTPPVTLGTPFLARIRFDDLRYAWCLYTPPGGEGTHTAATFAVEPARACAGDPRSRRGG